MFPSCRILLLLSSTLWILQLLKEATRLEKYEPFRTQRLLAKRGTKILSDEAKNFIIQDLAKI